MLCHEASKADVLSMREEVIKCRDESLAGQFNPNRAVVLSHLIQFLYDAVENYYKEDENPEKGS